jgi:hypothetical protein
MRGYDHRRVRVIYAIHISILLFLVILVFPNAAAVVVVTFLPLSRPFSIVPGTVYVVVEGIQAADVTITIMTTTTFF